MSDREGEALQRRNVYSEQVCATRSKAGQQYEEVVLIKTLYLHFTPGLESEDISMVRIHNTPSIRFRTSLPFFVPCSTNKSCLTRGPDISGCRSVSLFPICPVNIKKRPRARARNVVRRKKKGTTQLQKTICVTQVGLSPPLFYLRGERRPVIVADVGVLHIFFSASPDRLSHCAKKLFDSKSGGI